MRKLRRKCSESSAIEIVRYRHLDRRHHALGGVEEWGWGASWEPVPAAGFMMFDLGGSPMPGASITSLTGLL